VNFHAILRGLFFLSFSGVYLSFGIFTENLCCDLELRFLGSCIFRSFSLLFVQ